MKVNDITEEIIRTQPTAKMVDEMIALEEADHNIVVEEAQIPENKEISISYSDKDGIWNQNKING